MNLTLAHLTGRRAWYVPAVSVWGDLSAETVEMMATETDDNATRVVFQQFTVGGEDQVIMFSSLTDHRGNTLPASIDRPVVIPIAKNAIGVAILGRPSSVSFRAGKVSIAAADGIVDLWIVETRS